MLSGRSTDELRPPNLCLWCQKNNIDVESRHRATHQFATQTESETSHSRTVYIGLQANEKVFASGHCQLGKTSSPTKLRLSAQNKLMLPDA